MAADGSLEERCTGEAAAPSTGPLRELFRRTWEMELLISGAVVFGLLQVPARLDPLFQGLDPHLSKGLGLLPFAKLYTVRLDGEVVSDLELLFYRQPGSGQRGLIAMLPIRRLGRGRHLLEIDKQLPTDSNAAADEDDRCRHSIPFWR